MPAPPLPANETERLQAVRSYALLDTPPEAEYDAITKLASQICGTPVSLITLLDDKRQWFKSAHGIAAQETQREYAFCNYAIMEPLQPMVVSDLRHDERFSDNPLVTEDPHIVFYAGVPLTDSDGFALGSLCVIDVQEKTLNPFQIEALKTLAGQVVLLLGLRRKIKSLQTLQRLLEERNDELQKATRLLPKASLVAGELKQNVAALQKAALKEDEKEMLLRAEENLAAINDLLEKAKAAAGNR